MNRRRFLIASVAGALGTPLAVTAQQAGKVYRIGFLRAGQPLRTFIEAFGHGLREHGFVEGRNVAFEFRFTDGSVEPLPRLAEELVRLKVDVILASASSATMAAKHATTTVPIVFVPVVDPVEFGLVASLARPAGNLTGFALSSVDLFGKRIEILRELLPKLTRVVVLGDGGNPTNEMQLKAAAAAARTLAIDLELVTVQRPTDFDSIFKTVRGADGLLQLDSPLFTTHRARIVSLAASTRVPVIYAYREMVEAGGLISYGAHIPDLYRRAGSYVGKILKGAKPGDLPVEQPATFELVINLRTAKRSVSRSRRLCWRGPIR
jgi:putative ABC transport system substrate-binding protein